MTESIRYRLAKGSDVQNIANLHWESSKRQPSSFMFKLGYFFLVRYYKCILNEKQSVVLCAEDEEGILLGFVSGSIDASERTNTLRANKISLLLAAVPQVIMNPALIKDIFSRYYSGSVESGDGYIVQDGPHEDFWAWKEGYKSGNESILLHLAWLKMMNVLRVSHVRGEVDDENTLIVKTHKFLGAKIIKEYTTPDHRKRYVFEYDLSKIE